MKLIKAIGLMSGTSMDGIDAALIETDGYYKVRQLYSHSLAYDPRFTILLKSAEFAVNQANGNLALAKENYNYYLESFLLHNKQSQDFILHLAEYIHNNKNMKFSLDDIISHSTFLHCKAVEELIEIEDIKNIEVIGYHGQALYHKPKQSLTIQVGNGQLLANNFGIKVINNFRENDIKNGGQGAPLAPIYHQALAIRDNILPVVVLNCGGIANISTINGQQENDIRGFDTGPGNVLIDRYIRAHTNNRELIDKDGKYGLQGHVNESVMAALFEKSIIRENTNYFNLLPPKSLDPLEINLIPEIASLSFNDALATLEAFTAFTIVHSLKFITAPIPKLWVLAGGGWNNQVITNKLKEYLAINIDKNIKVVKANEINWSGSYIEAELFAYLAVRSLKQLPLSYPSTTNVKLPVTGGDIYIPSLN